MTHLRLSIVLLLAGFALAACNGSGPTAARGTAAIVLTDAGIEDIDTFEVDVRDITLRRLGGGTTEVLPLPVRVDFVELESLADLVASREVEAGVYDRVTLTLDFGSSSVWLAGKTTAARVVDAAGNPITGAFTVPIDLAPGSRPSIAADQFHTVLLDLDLGQALEIDLGLNQVAFDPVLSATFGSTLTKPMIARGRLKSVDFSAGRFVLERRTPNALAIQDLSIQTDSSTVFQVSGLSYRSAAGLFALLARTTLPSNIFVQGSFVAKDGLLLATTIETGNGSRGNGQDRVTGWVTARTGGAGANATLTVVGNSFDDGPSTRRFNTSHTIAVAFGQTKVMQRGTATATNTDAIQVGQFISAYGTLTDTDLAAADGNGVVRLLPTNILGTVTKTPANNTITCNIHRIGTQAVSAFDFTVASTQEVNPSAATMDATGLDLSGIDTGTKLQLRGTFLPVGLPSDQNFRTTGLTNRSSTDNLLRIRWPSVPATDALTIAEGKLTATVDQATSAAVTNGIEATSLTAAPVPTITRSGDTGIYRIVQSPAVELHTNYDNFLNALDARRSNRQLLRLTATGSFASATQTMTAVAVTAVLK